MNNFDVGEKVILNSPYWPAPQEVEYRGRTVIHAIVWDGKTQYPVPFNWISKKS